MISKKDITKYFGELNDHNLPKDLSVFQKNIHPLYGKFEDKWKTILYINKNIKEKFNKYEINIHGKIRNSTTKKILKRCTNGRQILLAPNILKNNNKKNRAVGKCLLFTFFPNIKHNQNVDHIFEENLFPDFKYLRHLNNLQWLSRSDNIRKSNFLQKNRKIKSAKTLSKEVELYNPVTGKVIQTYGSLVIAAKLSGSGSVYRKIKDNSFLKGTKNKFRYKIIPNLKDEIWFEPKKSDWWTENIGNLILKYSNKGRFLKPDGRKPKGCKQGESKYRVIGVKNKSYNAHKLIFIAHNGFFPKQFILHDDEAPLDSDSCYRNYPDDLKLGSQQENIRSSLRCGEMKKICKKVRAVDLDTLKVYTFDSCRDAERALKLNQSTIQKTMRNKNETYKNKYMFEFV